MKTKIEAKQLKKALENTLDQYSDDVIDLQKECVDEVTKEAHEILKKNAPIKRGRYKKSLKKKKMKESLTIKENVLYSDKYYRIAHLLERSHATRNGKRTKGKPHFQPADEYVQDNFEKRIKNKINNMK